jgi:hypothetical protein
MTAGALIGLFGLLVAGIAGASLGLALGSVRAAGSLALAGGVSAAAAFLVVVVVMRWLGWRVGHIDFPSRDTMQTVMGVGMGAAAVVGSAVLGTVLHDLVASEGVRP